MKVMFFVTDCRSFNELCEGQFEYYKQKYPEMEMVFLSGENLESEKVFRERNVGKLHTIAMKRMPSARDWINIIRVYSLIAQERPNVIVCSTPKAFFFGAICARLARVPKRVGIFRGFRQENMNKIKKSIFNFFDRIAIRNYSTVIYISKSLELAHVQKVGRPKRYTCINSSNGLAASKYTECSLSKEEKLILRKDNGISPSDFVIIVVGRICLEKGVVEIEALISSFSSHKHIKFLFVGTPDDTLGQSFFDRYSGHDSVIFQGGRQNLADYYNMADVHLFLSHREGFGNVAIEAAANGVPTIAYDVTGVKDSVLEGVSGWRSPKYDLVQVIKNIELMLKFKELGHNPFPEARLWATTEFEQKMIWEMYFREFQPQNFFEVR